MNEKKVLDNIIYPFDSEYPTEYIKIYYTLNNELEDIIESSGYKKTFLSKYQKSLRFLEGLKTRCFLGNSDLFEKLLDEDNLYSIRLFGEKNIRILFSFIDINGNGKAILLNVFEEKNKSDYESGKRIARVRKNEIINVLNNKE
ncbi:hypothetical protein [Anaerosalibacter sp. Marseille-P3206]|uniref:hypothetical protein n=1 Tax=Anaerosalibacter sp. Marseille-P3206 TaxID=1871005 RepID=UPI000985957A|nr:hypothetical protein [Anaerosalibacter sp. Marseille-P3206]